MKNVTRLFRELRKMGYIANQRVSDCRTCAPDEVEVYTTDQSYNGDKVWVYFHTIEGTTILRAIQKLKIPHVWDGKDSTAFMILEER